MRSETLWIGVLVVGLLLVVGLTVPVEQTISPGNADESFTVVTLNACWLFDGEGEEQFYNAPQCEEDAENEPRSCVDKLFKDLDPDTEGDEMINAAASIE